MNSFSGVKNMSKIYDVSLTISPDMATWPGDPGVVLDRISKIEEGAEANVSSIALGVHTGTHVDAPWHFISGGPTIETLDLNILTGPALVVHLPYTTAMITTEVLDALDIPVDTIRLLFRTRNSRYWEENPKTFQQDYVAIQPDAARKLVDMGVRLVGVDYFSVAPYHDQIPTHQVLLGAGIAVVEGLSLGAVEAGIYKLYCLPLKLGGSDGAPARAILVEE
jgi:arylformamidase